MNYAQHITLYWIAALAGPPAWRERNLRIALHYMRKEAGV